MDVEALVMTIVGPLVDGRLYWDTTPQGGPLKDDNGVYLPFIIGQIIGGMDQEYLDQSFPDHENVRLQLVSFSPSSLAATDLNRAARQALLSNYKPAGIVGSPTAIYDPRLLLRGRVQHFSLWVKP